MATLIEDIVTDGTEAKLPIAGALGYVYVDGVLATGTQLADVNGTAVPNPMVTDSLGHYKAYVTFTYQFVIKWNWAGRERYVEVHRSDAGIAAAAVNSANSAAAATTKATEAAASAVTAAAFTGAKSATTAGLIAAIRSNGFYPQPLTRTPAANIPTVSIGADYANSTLNGRNYVSPLVLVTDSKIKWLSGPTQIDNGYHFSRGWGGSTGTQYCAFEFTHTGTLFQLAVNDSFYGGGPLRILVNGQIAVETTVTGNANYLTYTFPSSATRQIRVEGAAGKFAGVNVTSAAEVTSTGKTYPLATCIGDSFNEGTGTPKTYDSESVIMGRALGLAFGNYALGGTGMLNPGGFVNQQDVSRITDLTLSGVIDGLTGAAVVPSIGFVMASINDSGDTTHWGGAATFQAAINNAVWKQIDAWATARTGKPLVFFGPTMPNNTPPLDIYRIRDGVQEACLGAAQSNVWFIDRLAPGPILRQGVYSTATDQAALYTGSDSTHPTPAGHKLDGFWMAGQVRSLILGEFS